MRRILFVLLIAAGSFGCGSSGPPPGMETGPELVDGGVIFRFYDRDARRVHIVGDFNNWSVRSDPMVDKNGDGQWTILYTLSPGIYEYKFVINRTKWIADPRNPETVPDGFDGVNSVLKIPKRPGE